MNLLNEKVKHTKFGTGVIKTNENGIMRIQFDAGIGEKSFIYPAAFGQFLKLNNPDLEEKVQTELKEIVPEKTRLIREDERLKEEERKVVREQARQKLKTARERAAKKVKSLQNVGSAS